MFYNNNINKYYKVYINHILHANHIRDVYILSRTVESFML